MSSLAAERSPTSDRVGILVEPRPGVAVVSIVGEFDVLSGQSVRRVLRSSRFNQSHVVLDLSQVTFMDAHAVGEIVCWRRMLTARCAGLSLVCTDGPAGRLLRMLDLDRVWTTYSTQKDALMAAFV